MSEPTPRIPTRDPNTLSSEAIALDLAIHDAIAHHGGEIDRFKGLDSKRHESLTLYPTPDNRKERVVLTSHSDGDRDETLVDATHILVSVRGDGEDPAIGEYLYHKREMLLLPITEFQFRSEPTRPVAEPSDKVKANIEEKIRTGTPERPARQGRIARALAGLHLLRR